MKARVFFPNALRLTLVISLACSMALATYAGSDHKPGAANGGVAVDIENFGKITIILYFVLQTVLLSATRVAYRHFREVRTLKRARDAVPTLILGRAADVEVPLRAIESGAMAKIWPVGLLSPARFIRDSELSVWFSVPSLVCVEEPSAKVPLVLPSMALFAVPPCAVLL